MIVVMTIHRTTLKPIPENSGSPTIPWATPTVKGFMKAAGEPGVGADQRDAAGGERVIAQRAGQEKEGGQKDEGLFGDADGPPADGKDERQDGDDQAPAGRRPS